MRKHAYLIFVRAGFIAIFFVSQPAMATSYIAPVIDPFIFEDIFIYGQQPGKYVFNSARGEDRNAYGGWVHDWWCCSTGWNDDSFLFEEDHISGGVINLDANHYTTLSNRMGSAAGPDPAGTHSDIVTLEGRSVFAPFDFGRGTLNNVIVNFDWTLYALLSMGLCDDCFACNAEGQGTAGTLILSWLGSPSNIFGFDYGLISQTDTGWHTSWSCFLGSFVDALNSDAWGGAPNLYDAMICFLNPDLCQYEPPDWSEWWSTIDQQQAKNSILLTPSEYEALLDPLGNFSVYTSISNTHTFAFEGSDTFDSSTYISTASGHISVMYDYASNPIPEPNTVSMLALGLMGLGFVIGFKRHRSKNTE